MSLFAPSGDLVATFRSTFAGARALHGRSSFRQTRRNIVRIVSDAALEMRGGIKSTHSTYIRFTTRRLDPYFSADFEIADLIGAISEMCSFVRFVLFSANNFRRKLIAYACGDRNVISGLTHREAWSVWAMYFLRLLARSAHPFQFSVSPLYISTYNNTDCDNHTRLSGQELQMMAAKRGGLSWLMGIFPATRSGVGGGWVFTWRVLTLPADSEARVSFLKQLEDKRIFRPKNFRNSSLVVIFPRAGSWRVGQTCVGTPNQVCDELATDFWKSKL